MKANSNSNSRLKQPGQCMRSLGPINGNNCAKKLLCFVVRDAVIGSEESLIKIL